MYRNETILGLSDSLDTFKLACSLAKFYGLDLWEVYVSFARNLLFEYEQLGLTLQDVETHIKPLLSVLHRRFDRFSSMMRDDILSKIEGGDLDKLTTYFTLLNDPDSQAHIKLLRKLKSVDFAGGFDYKLFMEKPLEAIEPFLDDTNVPFFTKLVSKLPVKHSGSVHNLSASKINVVWCLKKFWSQVNSETEKSESALDALDTIAEHIKKIDVDTDLAYFVEELTLSRRSVAKLSLLARRELAKRIGRLFRQAPSERFTKDLQRIQSHLRLVESVEKVCGGGARSYVEQIDYEMADAEASNEEKIHKLEEILVRMLFDSYSIETLNQLVKTLNISDKVSVKSLIKIGLNKISTMPRHDNCSIKLNVLMETISKYLNSVSNSQYIYLFMRIFGKFRWLLSQKAYILKITLNSRCFV